MKLYFIAFILFFAQCTSSKKGPEVFQKSGIALGGYDPVAFFREQKPVMGAASFTTKWNDAVWHFSTKENLDSFVNSPDRYAPQYGGYCAFGTAEGHKAPTEVDTWTILDGKLYFNYNQEVKGLWEKDRSKFIQQADGNWESIKFDE